MTKISFDVDLSKDPETLLKEIQDKAKSEVERRDSKERSKSFLANLHKAVNEKIGTSYNNATDLIRALADHASPAMRERVSGAASIGRRKTISMTKDLYQEIKVKLSHPSPNKAAIARETGASVVQVRKVASGGFAKKFGEGSDSLFPESGTIEQDAYIPITPLEVDTVEEEISTTETLSEPESITEEWSLPAPLPLPEVIEELDSLESKVDPSDVLPLSEFKTEDQESLEVSDSGSGDLSPLPPVPGQSEELGVVDSLSSIPAPSISKEELHPDSGELPLSDSEPEESSDETATPPPPAPPPPEAIDDNDSGGMPPKLKGRSGPGGLSKGKFSAKITRPPLPPGVVPPDS